MDNMTKKLLSIILLITCSYFSFSQDNDQKELKGIFQGKKESGKKISYLFKDEKDKTVIFEECNPKVLENFDLGGPILIGEKFRIKWVDLSKTETEVKSSSKKDNRILKIISLELISSESSTGVDEEPEL